jgi:hypothetical protein
MISPHVNSILSKIINSQKINCILDDNFEEYNLNVSVVNLSPETGTDIVLDLSNNQLITANDLEFASFKDENTLILGHYIFTLI